jgi:hypothetical protein
MSLFTKTANRMAYADGSIAQMQVGTREGFCSIPVNPVTYLTV